MNEYIFDKLDCDKDSIRMVKDFFNSLNLSGRLLDGVEKIISRCGFVINETYCHFPDFDDPDLSFEGIMFGVWDEEVVVSESVGFMYSRLACEKYLELHSDDSERVRLLITRLS